LLESRRTPEALAGQALTSHLAGLGTERLLPARTGAVLAPLKTELAPLGLELALGWRLPVLGRQLQSRPQQKAEDLLAKAALHILAWSAAGLAVY